MGSSTTSRNLLRVLALVGVLTLLTTGCGDDGESSSSPDTPDDSADTGDDIIDTPDDSADDGDDDGDSDGDAEDPVDRSAELVGSWTITTFQLGGGLGEADPVPGPEPISIEFLADGTMTFSTGCNTGQGEWEPFGVYQPENDNGFPVGQGISFGGMSRTEVDCDEELVEQDLSIPGGIRAADRFTLDGSTVTFLRNGDVMIAASR